jgi:hypothetical protein
VRLCKEWQAQVRDRLGFTRYEDLRMKLRTWLSIRSECLDRVVALGEAHRRLVVRQFVAHYHHERNHQGLANALVGPLDAEPPNGNGRVRRRERLGRLLNFYTRRAA